MRRNGLRVSGKSLMGMTCPCFALFLRGGIGKQLIGFDKRWDQTRFIASDSGARFNQTKGIMGQPSHVW
jgi:hypothetical protein